MPNLTHCFPHIFTKAWMDKDNEMGKWGHPFLCVDHVLEKGSIVDFYRFYVYNLISSTRHLQILEINWRKP